ncbi:MAG: metallophosphoesterase [Myxococcota bacterium]
MSRFAIFLLVLHVALFGLGYYVHRRSTKVFGLQRRGRWILALSMIAGVALFSLSRILDVSNGVQVVMSIAGTCVALGIVMAAGLLFHVDAAGGVWWAIDKVRKAPKPAEGATMTRRKFVEKTSAAAIVTGVGSSSYGALLGRHDYALETVAIPLPGLPRQLDGYTIVQLSDIHFGTFVQEPELRTAEALVRDARPDAIVLTGDLVDHDPRYVSFLGELVRRLGSLSRDGVFAIPGNHDHYAGVEEVVDTLRRAGAAALVNDGRVIADGSIALLGVDDLWARRASGSGGPDLQRALDQVPEALPKILLAHQPVFFEQSAAHVQLQLSGHTHGGQVSLGWNPAEIVLPHGWVRGRYDELGSTLYVNRGFGTAGPPARVMSPPEVTKIVLTSA